MSDVVNLSLEEARSIVVSALTASRTSPENAQSVANALVGAEADGQKGHGLSRVQSYTDQSFSGKVDGYARPTLERPKPGLLRVDAGFGFAFPAIDVVLERLPVMARQQSIAIATVRHSHHFGQAGAHCERLANDGLVALMFGNAPKAIAPWGGKSPLFGTNPIAFAAPMGEGKDPLVIDLALSRVARGKVMMANKAGEAIPEGWALDQEGKPTTDAKAAMSGTMIPIGEAKGAALAMMVEVLAAGLVGASLAFEASSLFTAEGPSPDLGQTIIAIDPQVTSGGAFLTKMASLSAAIEDEEGARTPGESRLAARSRAKKEGLYVAKSLYEEIQVIAGRS